MASNKNQHYVPQCYLRQFSIEGSSSAINLFNIDRKKFIHGAPIKNQCSRNYFYGDDLRLEKALQPIEGRYSSIVKLIQENGYKLTDAHRLFFRYFWLLQYMRTEAASRRSIQLSDEMGEFIGDSAREYRLELKEAVQQSMRIFAKQKHVVEDLKICLIKNKTNVDFVTSDDPAVLTNRLHLRQEDMRGESFGLGNAGNIIVLPLTPKILCLGYDGHVYSMKNKNGWIDIKSESDINALNELQFLNCRANIFAPNEATVIDSFSAVERKRPDVRHKINYAVLDKVESGYKSYKTVDYDEAKLHQEAMIHFQTIHIQPSMWPMQLRWRHKGFAYTNGSATGLIRESITRLDQYHEHGFRKVFI